MLSLCHRAHPWSSRPPVSLSEAKEAIHSLTILVIKPSGVSFSVLLLESQEGHKSGQPYCSYQLYANSPKKTRASTWLGWLPRPSCPRDHCREGLQEEMVGRGDPLSVKAGLLDFFLILISCSSVFFLLKPVHFFPLWNFSLHCSSFSQIQASLFVTQEATSASISILRWQPLSPIPLHSTSVRSRVTGFWALSLCPAKQQVGVVCCFCVLYCFSLGLSSMKVYVYIIMIFTILWNEV